MRVIYKAALRFLTRVQISGIRICIWNMQGWCIYRTMHKELQIHWTRERLTENLFAEFWKIRSERSFRFVILKLRLPIVDDPRLDVEWKIIHQSRSVAFNRAKILILRAALTFESIDTMINDVGWASDKLNLSWNAREFILESVRYSWEYQLSTTNFRWKHSPKFLRNREFRFNKAHLHYFPLMNNNSFVISKYKFLICRIGSLCDTILWRIQFYFSNYRAIYML